MFGDILQPFQKVLDESMKNFNEALKQMEPAQRKAFLQRKSRLEEAMKNQDFTDVQKVITELQNLAKRQANA